MSLLSAAYAAAARARRRSFERHPERQRVLRRPVVSVGNISVGGAGKTPAVAHIARLLVAAGERPAILTRGYRRLEPTEGVLVVSDGRRICADLRRAGDEPLMLARALDGVAVLVGADRHLSGVLAERRLGCTVHLLDDGFQHVQLHRDIDIVLVSAEDWRDRVLPAGRLRESIDTLSRADAIVVNGDADPELEAMARATGATAIFRATRRLALPASLESTRAGGTGGDASRPAYVALAGIARPRPFFDMLAAAGFRVVREMHFADHHWYSPRDVRQIVCAARESGADAVLTTEKDMVRLLALRPFALPVVAVPLEFAIEPRAQFGDWLAGRLALAHMVSPLEHTA